MDNGQATSTKVRHRRSPGPETVIGPGYVLDNKFELLESIGSGRAGRVFKAKHLILDTIKVVKIMSIPGVYAEESRVRFQREARIATNLRHENIVEINDADISKEGYPYIVMPFLVGESLQEWMARTPLEERDLFEISHIVIGIAEGLNEAHKQGIIHRDIKPENIFLYTREGDTYPTPMILDFGTARDIVREDPNRLTLPGQSFGTQGYMSPEQFRGDEPDSKSDIYSLGAVLYRLLTDTVPKPTEKLVRPRNINPITPRSIDSACMKALEPDPSNRFEDGEAFATALCFSDGESSRAEAPRLPRPKRALPLLLGSAALCILVVGYILLKPSIEKETVIAPKENQEHRTIPDEEPPKNDPVVEAPKEESTQPLSIPLPGAPPQSSRVVKTEHPTDRRPAGKTDRPEPQSAQISPPVLVKDEQRSEDDLPRDSQDDADYNAFIKQAEDHLEKTRFLDAESAFKEALRIRPNSGVAWHGLAAVARERGDYNLAAQRLEIALGQQNVGRWRLELALMTLKQGKKAEAITMWRQIAKDSSAREQIRKKATDYLKEYDTARSAP